MSPRGCVQARASRPLCFAQGRKPRRPGPGCPRPLGSWQGEQPCAEVAAESQDVAASRAPAHCPVSSPRSYGDLRCTPYCFIDSTPNSLWCTQISWVIIRSRRVILVTCLILITSQLAHIIRMLYFYDLLIYISF